MFKKLKLFNIFDLIQIIYMLLRGQIRGQVSVRGQVTVWWAQRFKQQGQAGNLLILTFYQIVHLKREGG